MVGATTNYENRMIWINKLTSYPRLPSVKHASHVLLLLQVIDYIVIDDRKYIAFAASRK